MLHTTLVLSIECSYHRSSSCLSYHLNAKHPTESSPRLDGRQPTLYDFSSKITRPVREKVTNALAVWVAGDCRTINIVKDAGLTEVIRIASFTFTFTFSHLADAFVQSDVQGREYSSYEQ